MDTYLRFETQLRCDETNRRLGVFFAAGLVEDDWKLDDDALQRLKAALNWFDENLTVPKLCDNRWRSVFWFRSSAQLVISRLWDVVSILRDEGVYLIQRRTNSPGMIVYSDEYQVAAIPPRGSRC